MKIICSENYVELSQFASDEIVSAIIENPSLILCMASGHTPVLTCELLVKKLRERNVDYSSVYFLGLDEWVGLPPANEGSCHYFFRTKLFEPLQWNPSQYFLFDAMADDLQNECKKMDDLIAVKGGIDLMLVGIGINGHIGFNEPGTSFNSLSHVAILDSTTTSVGKKYFDDGRVPDKGISIGLGHLLNAKRVLLMANAEKKAGVIKKTVEGEMKESFPASIMQMHKNGFILIDKEAASLLNKTY